MKYDPESFLPVDGIAEIESVAIISCDEELQESMRWKAAVSAEIFQVDLSQEEERGAAGIDGIIEVTGPIRQPAQFRGC